jgi:sodium transport system permease protein
VSRAILVVLAKEVKDNLRDRRTLMSALLFGPLFGPVFFAIMVSIMLTRTAGELDEALELPIAGAEHAPNLVRWLEEQNVSVRAAPEDPDAAILERRYDVVLVIPPDFAERFASGEPAPVRIVADSADSRAAKHSARARALLGAYGQQLAQLRVLARGLSPSLMSPIAIEEVDVATPAARAVLVLGTMTYFILFAVLIGGMYLAADTTAGERDRGSLEPLLSLPVARHELVAGKLGATCAYMLASLAITLTAFAVSLRFVPFERLDMVANFGPVVALRAFLVMAPFVLFGASLLTVVASFTRSYKEAQTWLSLVLVVPTLPIAIASLYALRPVGWMMVVPSLSQHLLITELIKGEPVPLASVLTSVGSTLALGVGLAWLATRLYRREAILG